MTATAQGDGKGKGRERRRFPRRDVEIAVFLRRKTGDVRLTTCDVSRHGAFLRTEQALPLRQLVQLRFRLPDGEIDAMCMVARWLDADHPRGPGVGVDFFALSKDAKNAWERFLHELRERDAAQGFDVAHTPTGTVALPPNVGVPLPEARPAAPATTPAAQLALAQRASGAAPTIPPVPKDDDPADWMAPSSLDPNARRRASTPPKPAVTAPTPVPAVFSRAQPPPPPDDDSRLEPSMLMLRLPDQAGVEAFIENEIERGGMFLKTLLMKEVGQKVEVVLVHPDTDEEFHLPGTVVRRVMTGPAESRGLGIFFRALPPEAHERLRAFAESGVEVVELGTPITPRQVELEAAVAREPDSAEALEALGSYLLDEEGDLGGALTALTRALVLGPSQVSIHASLARAYRKIGDAVKERAHERVAEALMLHQDRLKVRLGVGALDDL